MRDRNLIFHGMKEKGENVNAKGESGNFFQQTSVETVVHDTEHSGSCRVWQNTPCLYHISWSRQTFSNSEEVKGSEARSGIKFHLPQSRQNFRRTDGEEKAYQRAEEEALRKSWQDFC